MKTSEYLDKLLLRYSSKILVIEGGKVLIQVEKEKKSKKNSAKENQHNY